MDAMVLKMRRVGRTYGKGAQRVDALVDVDLDVAAGELVAVMGRSGSGKSSLLNLAGGLDEPTTGTVEVSGIDLGDLSTTGLARLRRQSVGYVFQQQPLRPWSEATRRPRFAYVGRRCRPRDGDVLWTC